MSAEVQQAPDPEFQVIKGKTPKAWMVLLYGQEGIGKSTLATFAPKPFFLDIENSLERVDCERSPVLSTWPDIQKWLRYFYTSTDYQTLVIDTTTALEEVLTAKILATHKKKTLSEFGYGLGFDILEKEWLDVLKILAEIKAIGRNILFVGHNKVETFKDPTTEDYDRFVPKLHKKVASLLTAKVDAVLFARNEIIVKEKESSDKVRAIGTGQRLLYTQDSPAFSAKNRFGLAPFVPMDKTIFDHLK